VLARVGDESGAEKLAAELEKSDPSSTVLMNYWLLVIRSAIQLRQGHPARAVSVLEVAAPTNWAIRVLSGIFTLSICVGKLPLLAHNGRAAAAEFQKIIDHSGIVLNYPTGALAFVQLGRAEVMSGDIGKARTAYQGFFALWKSADADIPILKQAKAEYAELQ
jgi:hypothetical protein